MNVFCPNCNTLYRVDPAKVPENGVRARCAVCSAVFAVRPEPGRPLASAPAPEPPVSVPVVAQPAPTPEPPPQSDPEPPSPPPPPPSLVERPVFAPPPPTAAPPAAARAGAPAGPAMPGRASAMTPPAMPPGSGARPGPAVRPAPPAFRPAGPTMPSGAPASRAGSSLGSAPAAPMEPAPTPLDDAPAAQPRAAPTPAARPINPFLTQDPSAKARRLARALISDMVVYHPAKRQEGLREGTLKDLFDDEIRKSWEEYSEQVGKEVAESTSYFKEALNEILADGRQIF